MIASLEKRLISLKRSEHVKHNQHRENAQGEEQSKERQAQLESASADGSDHIRSPDAAQQEKMPKRGLLDRFAHDLSHPPFGGLLAQPGQILRQGLGPLTEHPGHKGSP